MKRLLLPFLLGLTLTVSAQDNRDLPADYLPASFHAGRREALRALMPPNSVTVIFAYPTRKFSNDVDYLYHASPDLYYFSGYKEPHAALLIFKEEQTDSAGNHFSEILYVQKRNAQAEQWTGKRLGVDGAKAQLGLTAVFNGEDFKNLRLDFTRFDKIICDRLPADLSVHGDAGDLSKLIQVFREKAAIPDNPALNPHIDFKSFAALTNKLRGIKTPEEKALLRKAVEISCRGQNEVMKALRPDMSELEVQGLHEYIHKRYGAEEVGYGSIIGAGENGCVLHYEENTKQHIGTGTLLMDVGAEYHGYTADVTRTIPASGKFSEEEKTIYQLVYDAQEAAFKTLKDGSDWNTASNAARTVIADGLIKLGIIKKAEDVRRYYPHGLGHHIGLDVHDKGDYDKILKDMVITIEPGIYIPEGSPCDKKWWSIGVRIEDDCLITQDGYELLTRFAPRRTEDIEKMMAEKSVLDNYKLPPLESATPKKGF